MIGGDVVDPQELQRVMRQCPPEVVINAYGPTECTTFATAYRLPSTGVAAGAVPIGSPINNTQVYLLDAWQQPVPLGAVGEIYIGGDGVALGYLNLPEATAERFIADPFQGLGDARLYRTGDFGRWNEAGELLFLGRKDQMVKIRGFRVELGEIEARLSDVPGVTKAVVLLIPNEPGEAQLVAYYTCDTADGYSPVQLHQALSGHLPDYMLPMAYIAVEAFAITANGKLNRRALPGPVPADFISSPYEAPLPGMEQAVAGLWSELLGVEKVSRQDSFFNLGGHSLSAIRLISRLKQLLGITIALSTVFDHSTLAGFSEQLLVAAIAQKNATAKRQSHS